MAAIKNISNSIQSILRYKVQPGEIVKDVHDSVALLNILELGHIWAPGDEYTKKLLEKILDSSKVNTIPPYPKSQSTASNKYDAIPTPKVIVGKPYTEKSYPLPKYEHRDRPLFKKAMKTKYAKEWGSNKCGSTAKSKITDKKTKYLRLGYTQNPRKVEMTKCGAAITKKRGPIDQTK